ncbi:MAG: hypothetical protein V4585_06250 [Bacteroidota bacterium]
MKYQLIISENSNATAENLFNFKRYFFNEIAHLQHQGGEESYTFYWQNIVTRTIDARFSVLIKNNIAYSPLKATFGGIEFSESLSENVLSSFLVASISHLKDKIPNLKQLVMNAYPAGYFSVKQQEIQDNCLLKLGFYIKFTEQNFEIKISQKSFYNTVISLRAKQLLRKADKNKFIFKQELNPDLLNFHAFIERSRIRKNRPMTMDLVQLTEHFQKFPENFYFFSVYQNEQTIAVAVTIKINEEILYTFYLADHEDFLKDSPTTFLLSGIYEYTQQQNFKILDLGIATDKGILNEGLSHFKRSLGAELSDKKTYFILF